MVQPQRINKYYQSQVTKSYSRNRHSVCMCPCIPQSPGLAVMKQENQRLVHSEVHVGQAHSPARHHTHPSTPLNNLCS
eukprot:scaffold188387_cov16-Tisochrysis_lutea.AAC.3